ncbi:hypothetical protein Bca4012_061451 [Brassica carinata]
MKKVESLWKGFFFLHLGTHSEITLETPGIVDDFYLNILDWSSANVLAVALDNSVCLWDAFTGSVTELITYDEEDIGPVTSINRAHDGLHLGVGLNNGEVHIWDCETNSRLRTLEGCHHTRVGSLAWNSHILTINGRTYLQTTKCRSGHTLWLLTRVILKRQGRP